MMEGELSFFHCGFRLRICGVNRWEARKLRLEGGKSHKSVSSRCFLIYRAFLCLLNLSLISLVGKEIAAKTFLFRIRFYLTYNVPLSSPILGSHRCHIDELTAWKTIEFLSSPSLNFSSLLERLIANFAPLKHHFSARVCAMKEAAMH